MTIHGTPIPSTPVQGPPPLYPTVVDIRSNFGERVQDMSDASIEALISQMLSLLEEAMGHSFGRCIALRLGSGTVVEVTTTGLQVGADTYSFVDYPTLAAMYDAVAQDYSFDTVVHVDADTPSTYLTPLAATVSNGIDAISLFVSAMRYVIQGPLTRSHIFVPLPVSELLTVERNGVSVDSGSFTVIRGKSWILQRRTFGAPQYGFCLSTAYNSAITFRPQHWIGYPKSIWRVFYDLFAAMSDPDRGTMSSETIGPYKYVRTGDSKTLSEILLSNESVRFHSTMLPLHV